MSKENYDQIISEVYNRYYYHKDTFGPLTIAQFVEEIKTNNEFAEKWGIKIEEKELSLEERYNMWFNNNYETGMEKFFNPNELPDFDNSYYTPTPTRAIFITYNNETIEIYE